MPNFTASIHHSREWGVFHRPTRLWLEFGSERHMRRRANTLNDIERSQHELATARLASATATAH